MCVCIPLHVCKHPHGVQRVPPVHACAGCTCVHGVWMHGVCVCAHACAVHVCAVPALCTRSPRAPSAPPVGGISPGGSPRCGSARGERTGGGGGGGGKTTHDRGANPALQEGSGGATGGTCRLRHSPPPPPPPRSCCHGNKGSPEHPWVPPAPPVALAQRPGRCWGLGCRRGDGGVWGGGVWQCCSDPPQPHGSAGLHLLWDSTQHRPWSWGALAAVPKLWGQQCPGRVAQQPLATGPGSCLRMLPGSAGNGEACGSGPATVPSHQPSLLPS